MNIEEKNENTEKEPEEMAEDEKKSGSMFGFWIAIGVLLGIAIDGFVKAIDLGSGIAIGLLIGVALNGIYSKTGKSEK